MRPTALCSSNTVELFAISSRRSILHARQLNCTTFTEWEDLGGAFAGGPTAVKNARGQLEVFARGVDKHLYRRVSSGDCCAFDAAKWECLGGCFSSKPHALLSSQGMVHVFARGCDRSVWQLQQTRDDVGELVWGEWQSLGGVVSSAPVAGVDAEGLIHVFARGITRALVSTAQRWNLSAVVWEPWAALGGALMVRYHERRRAGSFVSFTSRKRAGSVHGWCAGSSRLESDRLGSNPIEPERIGTERIGSNRIGYDRIGSNRVGSDRVKEPQDTIANVGHIGAI